MYSVAVTCPVGMKYRKACGECIKDCDGNQLDPLCVESSSQCKLGCFCEEGMVVSNSGECIEKEECETETACLLDDGVTEVQVRRPILSFDNEISLISP